MIPARRIATIRSVVATGRRMKSRDGFTRGPIQKAAARTVDDLTAAMSGVGCSCVVPEC
jgi:hypothetical protein